MSQFITILFAILTHAARTAWVLLPYVVAGTMLGEALKFIPWTNKLAPVLQRRRWPALIAAAVLGAASPLCTFGTVPVVLRLYQAGVGAAPLAAFLAVSSLMNPQLFVMTWGGLGMGMALARLAAVLVFGVTLGLLAGALPRRWVVNPVLNAETENKTRGRTEGESFTLGRYLANNWSTLQYVGFYLLIGLLLGATVEVIVPGRFLTLIFQPGRWYSVLLASLLGVPLYACGGGTIPLIRDFMAGGMSRGAALGFFLVGPATRPTPLMALTSLVRPRFLLIYLGWLVLFAVGAGIVYG